MAISGSLVLAGAPFYRNTAARSAVGAVMVFVSTTTTVTFKQVLLKPDIRDFDYFGNAIAVVRQLTRWPAASGLTYGFAVARSMDALPSLVPIAPGRVPACPPLEECSSTLLAHPR